jgi:hypothetical protein
MVSRCEHPVNVVMLNKPKVLRGLAHMGAELVQEVSSLLS